jgi:hypothetical protein
VDGKSVYSLKVLFFFVGDVILKVDGKSVYGLTEAQIVQMVVGPPESKVSITVQSQYGFPYVVTAPFQELPFDLERDKKNKKKKKHNSPDDDGTGMRAAHALYGGGTLPPGFEHLESLRFVNVNSSLLLLNGSISRSLLTLVRTSGPRSLTQRRPYLFAPSSS